MLKQVDRSDPDGRGSGGGGEEQEDEDGEEGKGTEEEQRALTLMKDVLRVKDSRILDASSVRSFLHLRGEAAPTRDVLLVRGVKDLVHKMPLKVYTDPATRQVVLNGIQALLDEVIATEEASLDEEEEL
jgi:type III secretion system TyeA family effector delivery regulator